MRRGLLVLFGFLLAVGLRGQQYNFIHYSIEEGLAQSQIRAISQDEKGYLWIGTLGGLSKFDGIHFTNYSTNDGLLDNQINSIRSDSQGNLWFGTNGGVSVFDGEVFKNYVFKDEFKENSVLSIREDKQGRMWFATDGGGLVYLENEHLNYFSFNTKPDHNYIRFIAFNEEGRLFLATRAGVLSINQEFEVKVEIADVNATQVCFVENSIWCSTFGNGVIEKTQDTIINLTRDMGLVNNHIRGFVKRKDGSMWFVSKHGVSRYLSGEFTNFKTKDGLKEQNIKCVMEDDEGNLFFGTDGGGMAKFSNDDFVSYTQDDVEGTNVVMTIAEDQNNNIWLGTYGSGVGVFASKGYFLYTKTEGLGNNTVWCSIISHKPSLWVGTSNGFAEFDGSRFKSYDAKNGLNAKKVYALQEDDEGNIWVGTKEGVSVLWMGADTIENLDIARNIRYILMDDELIWFCSSDGLVAYNRKSESFKTYTKDDGLPHESVMNVLKDRQGRYWIGTTNGLAVKIKGEIKSIKLPGNFASNNINFLQLDKYDNLWIGTNYGLYRVNIFGKSSFFDTDFTRYSNLDGLKSLECNQNAAFIDSRSNLWFGTSFGLMRHKLSDQTKTTAMPKVLLTDMRLFFESYDFGEYGKGTDSITELPKAMVLPYDKNHLTFDFIGIYHTNPDKVKYRFMLEGFDEDWQPITSSTYVTYSNIPSGTFTFKISASTDLSNWTNPVTYSFEVRPPFWFTWWFFLLCAFTVAGIVYLIVQRRRRIVEEKRETQLIVDKSKMLTLEQQALNASMNRHFIFNALNSIQFYINRQDRVSANKYLSSFAKLVRKNLDSSLVNEIVLEEEIERVNLYLKLEQMRFQDKFTYEVKIDPSIDPQAIRIPSMLLQPFIENSIWHGILPSKKPGHIAVKLLQENDKLTITITDDGIGIDVSLAEKQDKKQHHESKGMALTKGRIDLIGKTSNRECAVKGPYQIYGDKGEVAGTEVSIVLSL